MAHQPFENWLITEESLTAAQQIELDDHLRGCPQCRELQAGLAGVNRLLSAAEMAAPKPGFSQRWQSLAARRKLEQQPRQVRIFILVLIEAALISLALLVTIMLVGRVSLAEILVPGARLVAGSINLGSQFVGWLGSNLSSPAAVVLWILFASGICLLVITWVVTVVRFSTRGVQKNETDS